VEGTPDAVQVGIGFVDHFTKSFPGYPLQGLANAMLFFGEFVKIILPIVCKSQEYDGPVLHYFLG
jgi:hypothetical protein